MISSVFYMRLAITILSFYAKLLWYAVVPLWYQRFQPDSSHFHQRRYTPAYIRKRRIVKCLWAAAGVVVLCFPVLPLIVGLTLFLTFVSFLILDESA